MLVWNWYSYKPTQLGQFSQPYSLLFLTKYISMPWDLPYLSKLATCIWFELQPPSVFRYISGMQGNAKCSVQLHFPSAVDSRKVLSGGKGYIRMRYSQTQAQNKLLCKYTWLCAAKITQLYSTVWIKEVWSYCEWAYVNSTTCLTLCLWGF